LAAVWKSMLQKTVVPVYPVIGRMEQRGWTNYEETANQKNNWQ